MIYEQIASNNRKTFLLVFIFFVLILGLGFALSQIIRIAVFPVMIFVVFISTLLAVVSFYNGDKVILQLSRAKPVSKKEYPFLVNTVEGLAIAAGVPAPKVYVIEEDAINAFATGRDPNNSSIAVTRGALKKLNRTELEGVIGHEMSHVKNYDIRLMMVVAVMIGITALLSDLLLRSSFRSRDREEGLNVFLLVGIVLAVLTPLIAQLVQFAISRKREFLADADGTMLTRYPDGLASALGKIKNDSSRLESANKATAHLYIANPLRNIGGWMNGLFQTHPPIDERIRILKSMSFEKQ